MFNKSEFINNIERILRADFGKSVAHAAAHEKYNAISKAIFEMTAGNWNHTDEAYEGKRKAYYLSAEFLMGRAFGNNLINLGVYDDVKEALSELDVDINRIEEFEGDAGLGNGGLGRLAACFLDSCATLNLPVVGYGIRYKYGIFTQKFVDGFQVEEADNWLKYGNPWSIPRFEDAVTVTFSDQVVQAVPYDTPVYGYGTENVNTLRLWEATPEEEFDFQYFNDQEYDKSVAKKNRAEDISRVLYPNDSTEEGKKLRLKQQYFFVSASLQDMVKKHKASGRNLSDFAQYHSVQLNDTHPVVAIPELMRILTEVEGLAWDEAWAISGKTFSYTNHTILAEALEKWWIGLYEELLPEIYEIIKKIDKMLVKDFTKRGMSKKEIEAMRIISDDLIHMAWMAIYGCHTTNGVAALHTDLLKNVELNNWYQIYPERFQNKTNGITPRRWVYYCNRELSGLFTELLGDNSWVSDLSKLKGLEEYVDDETVLKRFLDIKATKKAQLADYIMAHDGIEIDRNSIFDIQIKRLHEYKRQLLNAFHILDLYYRIKENPSMDIVPRTFIFGAKAAPGYLRAKGIIKFINEIAKLVNDDADVNGRIKVVFVENYRVTYGEMLFPAADVSEQISTAGKEASGTGNMKFMLNGAPTVGTYDGANVEIVEEAGFENNFIFGARVEELEEIAETYDPSKYYKTVPGLKKVVDTLIDGTFDDEGTGMFKELYDSLLKGAEWHEPDNYFIFRDFDDYREAQMAIDKAYRDEMNWAKKCWMNISNAGKFSSDRTIMEYADMIWHIESNKI